MFRTEMLASPEGFEPCRGDRNFYTDIINCRWFRIPATKPPTASPEAASPFLGTAAIATIVSVR